ncbi:lysophospholipid acyltransferase family protein [Paracoccus sp. 1_MG-2023]|uniref:lysophospholipid acyltransferase family protein n=1 Tax=unclassified Paracoccus (in: a-proteobacteria) TaxID=2688777 RepID=UPI001C08D4F3|nr:MULTISPECIES: lysophospholipid acyltransferase family protein [unclassified Paracoccus (in: a-proteobacteria)]MBU2958511.1 lysophospholipid acyltransferase family protein [Paracoccus sp. C2R09]MDO6668504.1 lysophospholipid acyltransferase family protein [Paracoccus sp. 1_MG-2023]
MREDGPTLIDRLANRVFLTVVGATGLLPYEKRIPVTGWIFSRVIAPVAGWRRRIRDNLSLARPDLSEPEIEEIVRAVPDNAGRSIAEIYSGDEFTARIHDADPLEGPGLPALLAAQEENRPVILACAHFGNYDAMRAALAGRGYPVGALFRPMNNEAFNMHYVPAIKAISEPLFPRGRAGLAAMLRFLRGGGWLALGFDQHDGSGAELRFFDLPTKTVLTPAELANRYDALLVPIAGIRQPDGIGFRVHVGAPIAKDEPRVMMQALNDDLEQLVRRHMGQWFWIHRRWK